MERKFDLQYFNTLVISIIGFIIVFIIYGILGYIFRNNARKTEIEKYYYGGDLTNKNMLGNTTERHISENIFLISILLISSMTNIIIGTKENLKTYWSGNGTYIDQLPQLILTTYITLITVISIFSKFQRNRYSFFTNSDLIEKFNISSKLKKMGIVSIISFVYFFISILVKNMNIYAIYFGIKSTLWVLFAIYLFYFFDIIFILIDLELGNRIEKKMLDNLYRELWYSPRRKIQIFTREVIDSQIDYLLEQYIKIVKRIDMDKISNVEYDTNLKYENKTKLMQLRMRCFIEVSVFLGVFLLIENFVFLVEKAFIKNFMILYGILLIVLLIAIFWFEGLTTTFITILYDRTSYHFSIKRGVDRYVPEVGMINWNKYSQFVLRTKNILALALLILDNKKWRKEYKRIVNICKNKISSIEEIKIIIILLDYFYFRKYNENFCTDINIADVNRYEAFVKSFIFDIEREVNNMSLSSKSYEKYYSFIMKKEKKR